MKHVYLWYMKMSHEALKKAFSDDKYGPNWEAKVKEVCKKKGLKLLFIGSPFGTIEQEVIGIESDSPLDEFGKVSND